MKYIYSILIGIIIGGLTLLGQKFLPMNFNFLANSGAIWLIPAYFVAKFDKQVKRSIAFSVIELEACVLGYYIIEAISNHHALEIYSFTILWLLCGVVGGFVIGVASNYAARKESKLTIMAQNILPAIFLSEGINKLIHIQHYQHMIPAVVLVTMIGAVLYFVIQQKQSLHWKNMVGLAVMTAFGLCFYEVILRITL